MMTLPVRAAVPASEITRIEQLIEKQHFKHAARQIDTLLTQYPGLASARLLQARLLFAKAEYEQALVVLKALSEEYPDAPEPYNNQAVIYATQQQVDKAQQQLTKALQTHAGYQTAYDNLTAIYDYLASQAYRQALIPDEKLEIAALKLNMTSHWQAIPMNKNAMAEAEATHDDKTSDFNTSEAPVQSVTDAKQAIKTRLEAWAQAWSAQDTDRYLRFYDPAFIPRSGMTRETWLSQRRVRLTKPAFIRIKLSDMQITPLSGQAAVARVSQNYQSDTMDDTVTKQFILRKEDDNWMIFRENLLR